MNESGPVGSDTLLTSALVYRLQGGGGGLPARMVTAEVTPGECRASLLGLRRQGSEPCVHRDSTSVSEVWAGGMRVFRISV